ncbi:hypothetical protein ACIGNX_02890 [Actinosynnema sp. NPDC053489]|uniref:hypothetical protein n=1 Tax=Actinosynnema sp. NPDC053489 TaxID=3363916 RepID=UPI0037C59E2B
MSHTAEPPVVGTTDRYASTRDAVVGTLGAVLDRVPLDVPLLVLADAWSRWAARRFARRCVEPGRQVRPSDSTGLETSELVRAFAIERGWRGPCYLLAGVDPLAGLRVARAFARRGPVVLCRVEPVDLDAADDPGCVVTAEVVSGSRS